MALLAENFERLAPAISSGSRAFIWSRVYGVSFCSSSVFFWKKSETLAISSVLMVAVVLPSSLVTVIPGFLLLLQAVNRQIATAPRKNTCLMIDGFDLISINVY